LEYSLLENMCFDVCILCVFLTFEGEKFFLKKKKKKGFLLIVESYFEREFLFFMILCYIMQFFIYDHVFYLYFFLFHICRDLFVECFRKFETLCQFVTKRGSLLGR
jgi:hypothetical protein